MPSILSAPASQPILTFRKTIKRITGWAISFFLMLTPPAAVAEEVTVDPNPIPAQATIGEGNASWRSADGVLTVHCQATGQAEYVENWRMQATVFDLRLPTPVPLPEGTDRIGLRVRNPAASAKVKADLRVLIADARGGEWAVSTQLRGKHGELPVLDSFEKIETLCFRATDTGRIDPWIMTALHPEKFDEYTQPQPPLRLLGVRIIVKSKGSLDFSLRDFRPLSGGDYAPCWSLSRNATMAYRVENEQQPLRYGWGSDEAEPFLRPADLRIAPGRYAVVWEISDLATQAPLASASEETEVAGDTPVAVRFPLLPAGTYRIHLYVRNVVSAQGKEFFLHNIVYAGGNVRRSTEHTLQKPLFCRSDNGPVFSPAQPAFISLQVAQPQPEDQIIWSLSAPDRRTLASGQTTPGGHIDLAPTFAQGENALYLEAKLLRDNVTVDILRRVYGLSTPAATAPTAPFTNTLGGKKLRLNGAFERTKGDWSEGGTPIVSRQAEFLKKYAQWCEDAKDTGYNIVELPAPWYELEPLPGIYQFRYLDEIVRLATARGLFVMLRVHPCVDRLPEWLPRETQRTADGRWQGLWKGESQPICSPASECLNQAQEKFLTALAAHYAANPEVIGYTLSNVYFDHGFLDMPYLGQYTDYSNAMRRAFLRYLQEKYQTLDRLNQAHGAVYADWSTVPLPLPKFAVTPEGRPLPRTEQLWLDFMDCKVTSLTLFRTRAIDALRRSDPGCVVGPYADDARALFENYLSANGANQIMLAQGSMEDRYPPQALDYVVRYEPIKKVTHTSLITDVGVSNLLFHAPDKNTFFNYWSVHWTIATAEPTVREAEARLKQWFSSVDRLAGARPLGSERTAHAPGLVLASLDALRNTWQHTFSPYYRENYLAPYLYRCRTESVDSRLLFFGSDATQFSKYSYLYIPYFCTQIDTDTAKRIADYVTAGGRLIVEGNAGEWAEYGRRSGSLRELLNLPGSNALPQGSSPNETAHQADDTNILQGLSLVFRTRQWLPPIGQEPTWLHRCARGYYLPARFPAALPPESKVLARIDDLPVAARIPSGKGEIIVFAGTIDWCATPDLAVQLDNWGKGLPLSLRHSRDPEVLVSSFIKGGVVYALGRRVIRGETLGDMLWGGKIPEETKHSHSTQIRIADIPEGIWSARELLSGKDCERATGEAIRERGLALSLRPGEAFLLELQLQ